MRKVLCVCYFVAVVIHPSLATSNREIQAVKAVHDAWALAFEAADINAAEKIWSHDGDVLFITPRGTRHKGFAAVKGALKNLFGEFDKTTLDISNLFLTVNGDEATITMTFQWSPVPGKTFPVIERYRKADGGWKLHASQTQGNLLPLRPEDEKAIKQLTSRVQNAFLTKDTATIAPVVANDFTYTDLNGTQHLSWQESAKILDADFAQFASLQLQSMALIKNQACARASLTLTDGEIRNVQFILVGPNWKLTMITLKPEVESLAVEPNGKTTTLWARIKVKALD